MDDADADAACDLSAKLRVWLRDHDASGQIQASAMSYELAALVAFHAPSIEDAIEVITQLTEQMKGQIERLGVWTEHP